MPGRSKLKLLLWAGAGIALLAGAALLLLAQNLDDLVRKGIESYGTAAAGTPVQVAEVRIALREGRGTLRGLTAANPPGFSDTPLLVVDSVDITLDTAALTGPVVIIDELRIGATAFRYEIGRRGESNLKTLQKTLRKTAKQAGDTKQPAEERRYRIKRLVIADGEATLDLGRQGVGTATARVPGVELDDLGGKAGLTAEQLSTVVLTALVGNLEKSVAKAGVERLLQGKGGVPVDEILKGLLGR